MNGKLVLVCLALGLGISFSLASWSHTTTPTQTPQPQPTRQEITIYYSQMDIGMAESLGCLSSGSGWLCHMVGAGGGGHAFED